MTQDETKSDKEATAKEKKTQTIAMKRKEAQEAAIIAETPKPTKFTEGAPTVAKGEVDCYVRCDYCRAFHTTIMKPATIGSTIVSLMEAGTIDTEIPKDKLITGRATCPGCGTPIPMRIRTDGTTAFIARQGIK